MSAASLLFDAPGPKARARYRLFTLLGLILAVGMLALVLWKLNQSGQRLCRSCSR